MEIALLTAIVWVVSILWYIVFKLLIVLEKFAKLLKADNLQEYLMQDENPENMINVWQNHEKFKDIWELTEEELRNIKPNPNIYWAVWSNPVTENFN